ncbi:hypothetical protein [Streptomyces sp. Inha503]|uniref:hypothetical protein n=1 Tax=Streptomyces sp. Inha503 TaxID=3383314 RepID=UPI0039A31B15
MSLCLKAISCDEYLAFVRTRDYWVRAVGNAGAASAEALGMAALCGTRPALAGIR